MTFLRTARPVQGLFVCTLLWGAALVGCSRSAPVSEPVRAVKLIEVGAQPAVATTTYAGQVQARTESRLGFQVAGKLLQRPVQVGAVVAQGDLLAQIDGQDYALAAQAAQAQVAAATTQRDVAAADWRRYSALKDQGFISGVELDRRHAALQSAQAQLDQAQAQAQAQGNQSRYTRLLAPAAGVVTAVLAEPGQVVAAGAPVVQLAYDGDRDVAFAVPESAQAAVTVGQAVSVTDWVARGPWTGVVREVAASADPVTRTYAVKAQLQGAAPPALGATVQVHMQLAPTTADAAGAAMTLPLTAVRQHGQGSAVWVYDAASHTVRTQAVQLGGTQGESVIVTAGLTPGQQVVATGTHVLTEGQTVTPYVPRHPEAAHTTP